MSELILPTSHIHDEAETIGFDKYRFTDGTTLSHLRFTMDSTSTDEAYVVSDPEGAIIPDPSDTSERYPASARLAALLLEVYQETGRLPRL